MAMTLRESLGGDVQRIYEQVDRLLDQDHALLVFIEGERLVSYANGFGASPCQLELLAIEVERALRTIIGRSLTKVKRKRRSSEDIQSSRSDDDVNGDRRCSAGRLLRMAGKTA
jgi:hypothetical protein